MITIIVLPGCLDQYLVPQNREEKEKKKNPLHLVHMKKKERIMNSCQKHIPYQKCNYFGTRAWRPNNKKAAKRAHFYAHCHLSVAYPSFTWRRQDEKKQPGSSSRNGCCIHFKRAARRKSLPVSIHCKLAGLESYKLSVPSSVPYYEQTYWAAKIFLVQPIPAFFGSSCSSSLSSHVHFSTPSYCHVVFQVWLQLPLVSAAEVLRFTALLQTANRVAPSCT